MDYYMGVDFGNRQDHTAIAIVRRAKSLSPDEPCFYQLLYLERIDLGVSYIEIVDRIRKILSDEWLRGQVVVIADATGVGLPIIQMMRQKGIYPLVPISIHGGVAVNPKQDGYSVPKRDLVTSMQVIVEARRLRVAGNIQYRDQFVKELEGFTMSTSRAGADTYEALTQATHDDLVLAVSYALWYPEKTLGMYTGDVSSTAPKDYDSL